MTISANWITAAKLLFVRYVSLLNCIACWLRSSEWPWENDCGLAARFDSATMMITEQAHLLSLQMTCLPAAPFPPLNTINIKIDGKQFESIWHQQQPTNFISFLRLNGGSDLFFLLPRAVTREKEEAQTVWRVCCYVVVASAVKWSQISNECWPYVANRLTETKSGGGCHIWRFLRQKVCILRVQCCHILEADYFSDR